MKFQKKYGMFRYINNVLHGYVEKSFSMDWDPEHVLVLSKKSIDFYINEKKKDANTNPLARPDTFILRLTAKNLPVKIDWESQKECDDDGYITKFNRRNVRFRVKKNF